MDLNTCSQLVVIFGEVIDPLGGRTLMKEVCHLGWASGIHSLALLFFSICPVCV